MSAIKAIRGRLLSYEPDPVYRPDGLIRVEAGRIAAVGAAGDLLPALPAGTLVAEHGDALILPGFIDLHCHLPQTGVVASFGTRLLDWLDRSVFPEEARFGDPAVAAAGAEFLLDELLRNGTTSAVVYGSVHRQSVDALFTAAARRGAAMVAGKVLMDRNAPAALLDSAQSAYDQSKALIERWHGRDRQLYAVSPRFAVTSSPAQLDAAGALLREHGDVFLQTHLAENQAEIAAVAAAFPDAADYVDVYDRHGLLGRRSLFGHCLHLSPRELGRLADSGSVAVLCPTSNLFLGSGLADLGALQNHGVRTGLATDIGAGTSYSMLRTAAELYKVEQLRGRAWTAHQAFHTITRGNAEALGLAGEIGSLRPGCVADLTVLDPGATAAMARRLERCRSLEDELFLLLTLGDDRAVAATYLQGERYFPSCFGPNE